MKKILVVGHSHVNALKDSNPEEGFEFCSLVGANGLASFVKKNIPSSEYDALVCSIQGSQYNIFGLVKHPQPFDFYWPDEPGLPIDEDAELLPLSLVTSIFKRDLRATFHILDTIKKISRIKTYFLEPPPPVPSEAHIRKHPSSFREKINQHGVSPAVFRYKLWRLQAKLVREHCASLGLDYIPVPKEAQNRQGLLRRPYWNIDPTHGNAAYGALVLNQIRSLHYHED